MCCIEALSMSEMSKLLNRKEDSIINHYVTPMCNEGVLKR